jgi:hypothetical protein
MVSQSLLEFSDHLMIKSMKAIGSMIDLRACRFSDTWNLKVEECNCGLTALITMANLVMD